MGHVKGNLPYVSGMGGGKQTGGVGKDDGIHSRQRILQDGGESHPGRDGG